MLSETYHMFRGPLDQDQRLGMALIASVLLHALMWVSLSSYFLPGSVVARPVYAPLSIRIERSPKSPATPVVINDKKALLRQKLSTPKPVAIAAPVDFEPSSSQPGVSISDAMYLRPISSHVSSSLLATGEFLRSSDISQKPEVIAMRVPKYPRSAWERKASGWVVVMFLVDERGKVVDIAAVESSESFGDYERDIAEDLRHSTFVPGKLDGRAVKALTFAKVRFDYRDSSGLEPATHARAPVSIANDQTR
ncbi:MAG TPA: energy transducer TonB [Burkholderiales bacterium]|nr:energy transducer TonB [Burkholderiales bacterium]